MGNSMSYSSGLTCPNPTPSREQPLITDPASVRPESPSISLTPAPGPVTLLRDYWHAHAKEWIRWVRAPGRQDSYWRFHRQHFLSLVPNSAPGELTIDVGCGEGRVGRDLRDLGHRVLGIDFSTIMCQAAATYPDNPCRVIAGDAVKLPLADATADCAIAFMSLQDIDDMPRAIMEIARVLKDGRKVALAIVHPMYSAAGRNPDDNFVIQRPYFKHELCISTEKQDDLTVTFHRKHRPLEDYMQALIAADFIIDQWYELTDNDEAKAQHRVPMFLDILATRRPREKELGSAHQPENSHAVPRLPRRRGHVDRRHAGNSESRRPGGSSRPITSVRTFRGAHGAAYLSLGLGGGALCGLIALALAIFHLR
jgi:SAM-dependent methyltransferase